MLIEKRNKLRLSIESAQSLTYSEEGWKDGWIGFLQSVGAIAVGGLMGYGVGRLIGGHAGGEVGSGIGAGITQSALSAAKMLKIKKLRAELQANAKRLAELNRTVYAEAKQSGIVLKQRDALPMNTANVIAVAVIGGVLALTGPRERLGAYVVTGAVNYEIGRLSELIVAQERELRELVTDAQEDIVQQSKNK